MTNLYFLNKQITAKLVAAVTVVSLLMSALPVAFFVAFATEVPKVNQDGEKMVNICHQTGEGFQFISVNANSIGNGHGNGDGDIIPVLDSVVSPYPGQNLDTEYGADTGAELLANECVPTPVDVCPDLDGMQTSTESCPVPPVDVCPNIPQTQETLSGYVKDVAGNCIPAVTPVCENGPNLLTNASFEEPVADANTHAGGLWEIFSSVLGWTISSDGLEIWNGLFGGASTGMQNAELDGNQNTNISQTITTIPGATYELKFDFSARPNVVDNAITAKVDGVDIASATADGTGLTTTSWQTITQSFVATTTTTQVQFIDNGVSNSYGSLIDNTAVCFVSEPVDPEPVATIVATKIVCADEADLPNWNTNGQAPTIDENTASDFIATKSEGECWLEEGWEFEWAHQGAADPGDTATGTAGAQWTTFEPTDGLGVAEVSLDEDMLDGSSYLWVREVLKDGYIPFTHGATPDNSNNVTAEMYCHTDGLNYDNLDRIDGVAVDTTYHCVAFNAEVPEPAPMCEIELVSSISTVLDTFETAVATYDNHPAWTADIEGATWVWSDEYVVDASVAETHVFTETFTVDSPSSALLDIAADNTYLVYVNDILVLDRSAVENNFADHTQKTDVDIAAYLVDGENELRIEVTNLAQSGGNQFSNPAGVLFRLDVVGETGCGITTEPETPVVEVEDTFVIEGYKYEVDGETTTPKAGWTIYATDGEVTLSTTTDATGKYYFVVEEGLWEVSEAMPALWEQVKVVQNGYEFESESTIDTCTFELFAYEPSLLKQVLVEVFEPEIETNSCDFYNDFVGEIVPPPVDVCSNLEGDQSVIPEGYEKIGETNVCTLIPVIVTPDNNSNGGGTRTGSRNSGRSGQVLGASTMQCGMYLFDYMKEGTANDEFEVKKLQWFLIGQGYAVPVTGIFDDATDAAVKAFQLKYQSDVLTPWFEAGYVPHQNPTGWVYQLTRWKINNIVCPGSEAAPVLLP